MARPQLNREARNSRATVLAGFMGMGFATLLAGTVKLQLIKHDDYRQLAEQNRVRLEVVRAPRGRIFYRKGRLIADNAPAFSIVFRPPDFGVVTSDTLATEQAALLTKILGLPASAQNTTRSVSRSGVMPKTDSSCDTEDRARSPAAVHRASR